MAVDNYYHERSYTTLKKLTAKLTAAEIGKNVAVGIVPQGEPEVGDA